MNRRAEIGSLASLNCHKLTKLNNLDRQAQRSLEKNYKNVFGLFVSAPPKTMLDTCSNLTSFEQHHQSGCRENSRTRRYYLARGERM